jgi:hypothetical protein
VTYELSEESGTILENCFFKVVVQGVFERIDVVRALEQESSVVLTSKTAECM